MNQAHADVMAKVRSIAPPKVIDPEFSVQKNGVPHPTLANAIEALRSWRGIVALNELSSELVTLRAPPWFTSDVAPTWEPGPWGTDEDVLTCQWLSKTYGVRVNLDVVRLAIMNVASHTRLHPIRDWLSSLKWDGRERVPTLASRYFGADDSPYTREVSRILMVGAVARVQEPGCKVDTMPVLEGPQGIGKSSGIKALVGADWFSDTPLELGSKDRFVALRGKWVIEIAELDGFDRHETTRVKSFISSPVDTYRAPYAKGDERFPRQCVFVATTNAAAYLSDATGNRRFLPVACRAVDLRAITRDREQLWAEAAARYARKETWWPDTSVVGLFAEEQAARAVEDSWEGSIAAYMATKTEVTMAELLRRAIGIVDEARHGPAEQRRAKAILTKLGYQRVQRRVCGVATWLYVSTEPAKFGEGGK